MRVALAVIAALGAILLFLLASASANTALFAENYPWLLAINGVAAVALLVLVGLQLARLRRDVRDGIFGSRLKTRLLLMLSVNVTAMYRDPTFFRAFREQVVPLLRSHPFVRIWHAGCSTGEEV